MADIRGQGGDEAGPYSPNRASATNLSIGVGPKPRQGIKMDPTDDAHLVTHQPPFGSTIGVGDDYTMPRAGPVSNYKVPGKDD